MTIQASSYTSTISLIGSKIFKMQIELGVRRMKCTILPLVAVRSLCPSVEFQGSLRLTLPTISLMSSLVFVDANFVYSGPAGRFCVL